MPTREMAELDMTMTVEDFLRRVLVSALENEVYEIQSVFVYGGNVIDFNMAITRVRPAAPLDTLQTARN